MYGQRDLDRDRVRGDPVVVDIVGERERALGPAPDFFAGQALGIIQQFGEIGSRKRRAVALEQTREFAHTHLRRRILRLKVAEHPVGNTDVQRDQTRNRVVHAPGFVKLERRDAQPLLEDLGGVAGVGSGYPATHIGMVADHHAEPLTHAFIKERHEHEDIWQVHAALIGFVQDHGVAGDEVAAIAGEDLLHRLGNCTEVQRDRLGLRDHPALRIADGRGVIHDVLDDLGTRSAQHRVGDLIDDCIHRVLDDREGHGVNGLAHAGSPSISITMLPIESAQALAPGGTTIVVS